MLNVVHLQCESTGKVELNVVCPLLLLGRFGRNAGVTAAQWESAIKKWESLGYRVTAMPFN